MTTPTAHEKPTLADFAGTIVLVGAGKMGSAMLDGWLHIGIFLAKMLFVVFMIIWVRWMWPRFRYDQLMNLGWRRFIPVALANIVATAVVIWWRTQ